MLKQRESYGVLYTAGGVLMLERLVYPSRVNAVPFEAPKLPDNAAPMIEVAQALLATLPQGSDWANQTDRTLDALTAAVEAKLGTGELTGTPEPKPAVTQAPDLMASLTASVEAAKAARGQEAKPRATRKSTRKAVA
jgi:non-homologous end joining protein Ku